MVVTHAAARDAAIALMTEPNNELIADLILARSDYGVQIIFAQSPCLFLAARGTEQFQPLKRRIYIHKASQRLWGYRKVSPDTLRNISRRLFKTISFEMSQRHEPGFRLNVLQARPHIPREAHRESLKIFIRVIHLFGSYCIDYLSSILPMPMTPATLLSHANSMKLVVGNHQPQSPSQFHHKKLLQM